MKKILFAFGALALMAAGCSQSASNNASSSAGAMGSESSQSQSSQSQGSTGASASSGINTTVKINNVDDAVNALESDSSAVQAKAAGSDDTDLLNSDSTDINTMTGAANAQ